MVRESFAFFASGRVPQAAVEAASAGLPDAIGRPELATAFAQAGMTPASSSPATPVARIASEQRYWQPVLRANDTRAD